MELYTYPANDYRSYLRHSDEVEQKYGLPDKKKYPMPDRDHVMSAIKFFNYVSPADEKELAKNIIARIKEYGITDINVGENNRFRKYYKPDHLEHHGILGMKWGVRRYQNSDGSLTTAGKKHYSDPNPRRRAMIIARDHAKLAVSDNKMSSSDRLKVFLDYQKKISDLKPGEFTDADEVAHNKLLNKFNKQKYKLEKSELKRFNKQISEDLNNIAYDMRIKNPTEEWLSNEKHKFLREHVQNRLNKVNDRLNRNSKSLEDAVNRKIELIDKSEASDKLNKIDKRYMALSGFDLSAETIKSKSNAAISDATKKQIEKQKRRELNRYMQQQEFIRQQNEIVRQQNEIIRQQQETAIQQEAQRIMQQQINTIMDQHIQTAMLNNQMMYF